jgi:hypothetical protein
MGSSKETNKYRLWFYGLWAIASVPVTPFQLTLTAFDSLASHSNANKNTENWYSSAFVEACRPLTPAAQFPLVCQLLMATVHASLTRVATRDPPATNDGWFYKCRVARGVGDVKRVSMIHTTVIERLYQATSLTFSPFLSEPTTLDF